MAGSFSRLRPLCQEAVTDGVVPGLVVTVGTGGTTAFVEGFGAAPDTVYDLASLTKALVTSLLAMRAVTAGRLALDAPLMDGGPTARQTLAHAGGFVAHRPFFERAQGRGQIVALAAMEPRAYEPGTQSVYSDLGFILLGDALERLLGDRLDRLAARAIFQPLGVKARFVDLAQPERPAAAPTQRVPGEVDDQNAYAMGGVAGHAGLFGSAADVAAIAHALCAAWRDGGSLVDREVLRLFWSPAGVPGSNWRLGWDGPSASGSLAGDVIARRAVGHLGFTGCSLWIDAERETFVAMLSNRVHPTVRDDPRFPALRRAVNDAALVDAGYRS